MFSQLFHILGTDANKLRWLIAGLLLSAVLQGIGFSVLVPLLRTILGGNPQKAWHWVFVELAILMIYAAIAYWAKRTGITVSKELAGRLWQRLGDHISTLPLGWFSAGQVGHVAKLTSDGVFNVIGLPTNMLRPLIDSFVTPAIVVALMALFDWRLALAVAATAPFIALAYNLSIRLLVGFDKQYHTAAVNMANRLVEFAQTQPVLRAFSGTENSLQLLDNSLLEARNTERKILKRGAIGQIMFSVVIQASFTVVLFVGTARALGARIDAPELIALLILVTRYIQPLLETANLGSSLRVVRNNLRRIDTLLATPGLAEPIPPQQVQDASVEFTNVSFGYEENRTILEDISFYVKPNTMTALVGPSGSGKTTITRLIGRFWDANSGAIKVAGCNVKDLSGSDLMAQVSFVFQDVYLFAGTIEENIRLAKPDASVDELNQAIRSARVDEILERLPDGLASQVGEGGNSLSGGERQRVSIARALLKDAPIILLDEATAALDAENEALIQEALSALSANRTLIVVAHRLQTIMAADQIVVLDNKHIVERGKHHDLLAAGGRYADFWKERERAKGWRIVPDKIAV